MSALDVVGRGEIALMLGLTPKQAGSITRRRSFPAPAARLSIGRVWRRTDVERWVAQHWDEHA